MIPNGFPELGDVLNKCLFKGRCCPVLPQNIPWDLESWPLHSGITLFLGWESTAFPWRKSFPVWGSSILPQVWDSSPGLPHIVSHFWVYFLFFFFFKTFCIFSLLAALARVVLFCRQPLELEMSNPSFCHQWLVKEPALIARLCNSNSLESCCKSLGLSSPRPGATSSSSLFFARKHWSHFSILIFF